MQDEAALAVLRIPRTRGTDAATNATPFIGEDFADTGLYGCTDLIGDLSQQPSPVIAWEKVGGENE